MKRATRDTVDRHLKWTSWSCVAAGLAIGLAVLLGRGISSERASEAPDVPLTAASLSLPADQHPATALTKIKDVRLGQRVAGRNPDRSEVDDSLPDPVADQWRHLRLRMAKDNGDELAIELLRPIEWIEFYGAAPGHTIDLDLAEMGAEGPAEVLSVSPCPPIQPGNGNVVTGTFAHRSSGDLINLHIAGEPELIGVTRNHRFWSEDRQQFVEAGELEPDESLLTPSGATTWVTSISPRPSDEAVFNLEVHREHIYLAGRCGALVHNNYQEEASRVLTQVRHRDQIDVLVEASKPSMRGRLGKDHLYFNPGYHDPSNWGFPYRRDKSVIPADHLGLFRQSVVADDVTRYALDSAGNIHWFQGSIAGDGVRFHWSGQTNGFTRDRIPKSLHPDHISRAKEVLGL